MEEPKTRLSIEDYDDLLRWHGAAVLAYQKFGSYQGDWYALVEWEGRRFWIHDYYGSCSGCDALESETGYHYHYSYKKYPNPCPECGKIEHNFHALARGYLGSPMTYEEVIAYAAKNGAWDVSAEEMVSWIKLVEEEYNGRVDEDAAE